MNIIDDISRYIDEVVSLEELKSILSTGQKLTIKYGVDCTAPFLHLGHAVNLWVMRRFQEEGHKVVFLIGNFTSKIGDPTGRSTTRKMLADDEIENAASEFIKQVGAVLITDDPNVFEIRRNAEWYEKMPLADFIGLCASVTHSKLISRDMFKKRIQDGGEISMNELLYPVLQGYDSVMLESDLTVVGTDQLFNEMMGRFFQEKFGKSKQIVMTTKITKGLWGEEKQSKSIGNFVALTDSPRDKFGKIMSLADDRIVNWMEVYTDISMSRIAEIHSELKRGTLNPRDAKLELAEAIVRRYHGEEKAVAEKQFFIKTFSAKAFPSDAPILMIKADALSSTDLVLAATPDISRSQARRVIEQGGLTYSGQRITDPKATIEILKEAELKIGKRKFFKVIHA